MARSCCCLGCDGCARRSCALPALIALHDEEAAYAKESATLRALGGFPQGWDRVAVSTSFKMTMVEGIDVVFIVVVWTAAGKVADWATSARSFWWSCLA